MVLSEKGKESTECTGEKGCRAKWLLPITPAFRRGKEDCLEFKINRGYYIVSSRPTWATETLPQNTAKKKKLTKVKSYNQKRFVNKRFRNKIIKNKMK